MRTRTDDTSATNHRDLSDTPEILKPLLMYTIRLDLPYLKFNITIRLNYNTTNEIHKYIKNHSPHIEIQGNKTRRFRHRNKIYECLHFQVPITYSIMFTYQMKIQLLASHTYSIIHYRYKSIINTYDYVIR